MAKQDVLDAINATIAPNGIKGITAESLNNVLTMMTEHAGEGGSGDGALRIIVPELAFLGLFMVDLGEFTPTSWATLKLMLEEEGLDVSEYDAVVNASFVHNANVAKQLLEKAREGRGVSVILDQTSFSSALVSYCLQNNPGYDVIFDEAVFGGVQPAASYVSYQKVTPEGAPVLNGNEEDFECVLVPLNGIGYYKVDLLYPSIPIALDINGNLFFELIPEEQPSNGVVTFYATYGEDLPNEYKEKNAEAFSAFESGSLVTLQLYIAGAIRSTMTPYTTSKESDAIILGLLQEVDNVITVVPYVINADGSANLLQ